MKQEDFWDETIRKSLKELPVEEVPAGFTKQVMDAINVMERRPVRYTPVFSKTAWVLIFCLALVLMVAGYTSSLQNEALLFLTRDLNLMPFTFLSSDGSSFTSDTRIVVYSLLAFCSLFSLQIILLKRNWVNKQVYF
ncbi:hypothetical protein [Muriicola marianensis]|uniref:DUF3667 domain-containing protein n=1 Tax=Muriicola marianensis TaxID=1324801 RepID=A0ABQ1QV70_9FLAO|nr:hypothetical protein [Muriicola marianensis]GGD43738.1 hypothetical protein GCM10011361_08370 [Muriicola marianensis]